LQEEYKYQSEKREQKWTDVGAKYISV